MNKKIEERMRYYKSFSKNTPTDIAKHIGSRNTKYALEGTLHGDEFLVEAHTLLRFIREHAKKIDLCNSVKNVLECNCYIQ